MSLIASALATRAGFLLRPFVVTSWLVRSVLAVVFVAAVVYVAWKVGSYYDAARKKL